ncbi:LOW QUALITY PROTEIN: protein phosphatase 1 regulatory subunit 21-like [Acropora millepora]|uniref:LOW QUALITY PROTEIN: protein phosphatase 1 regulatory subunit 21-like n=1 Tax=Acropora millepora TaxID=45264 RepID=UPI001CF541E1|nr:LOW QUALITY PROTEIN: protein phosphatase 1 regulatory subunit 21-like [Acropora millepora]
MSADSQNLQTKYQKLAAEFAKQRAQVTVLKKAVIEEQGKTKTLQENVRQKDQSIRKFEQEIDSLQFRNDQLSKRVAILQEELDEYDGKNRRGKTRVDGVTRPDDNDVKDQELQIKIQENERLQRELYEASQEHKGSILSLQDKLEAYERNSTDYQKVLDEANEKHRMVVEKLNEERAMLEARLHKTEEELRHASLKAEKSHQQLKLLHKEMTSRYDNVSKVVTEKLPFNDTSIREFNKLNVPTYDRKHQVKAKELICQAVELLHELVTAMSNFHTYTEQRLKIVFVESNQQQLSPATQKFCDYLHENAAVLRSVDESFSSFYNSIKTDNLISLETIPGFHEFSEAFHKYNNYLKKLLPYYVLSTSEECKASTCSSTLEAYNKALLHSLTKLITTFNKIASHIGALASASSGSEGILSANYSSLLTLLNTSCQELHECVKVLSSHFQSKVSLEHQLPTVTQTLKRTDECLVSSLVSLVTVTAKIAKFMNNNLEFFSTKSGIKSRGLTTTTGSEMTSSPAVVEFRHHAADYIAKLIKPRPESVPYKMALYNHKVLVSSTESKESLEKQISVTNERISKLEQDKEHWMLESRLLQVKYEGIEESAGFAARTQQSIGKRKWLTSLVELHLSQTKLTQRHQSLTSHSYEVAPPPSDLGALEALKLEESAEDVARETLIKNHFTQRIAELTSKVQFTESKAASTNAECRALYRRMKQTETVKQELAKSLKIATAKVSQLEDEVETVKRSYETQLSMMSDHLCGMNEKLTSQQDEIEALKSGKGKKGKQR